MVSGCWFLTMCACEHPSEHVDFGLRNTLDFCYASTLLGVQEDRPLGRRTTVSSLQRQHSVLTILASVCCYCLGIFDSKETLGTLVSTEKNVFVVLYFCVSFTDYLLCSGRVYRLPLSDLFLIDIRLVYFVPWPLLPCTRKRQNMSRQLRASSVKYSLSFPPPQRYNLTLLHNCTTIKSTNE